MTKATAKKTVATMSAEQRQELYTKIQLAQEATGFVGFAAVATMNPALRTSATALLVTMGA